MDVITDRLAAVPLLAPLTREQRQRLARAAERLFVAPDKTLVERGELADATYLCLDDMLSSEYDDAGETKTVSLPEGATILEMAMIVETEAVARFAAVGHSRVIRISRQKLRDILARDTDLAEALGRSLTERLNEMAGEMRELSAAFHVSSNNCSEEGPASAQIEERKSA